MKTQHLNKSFNKTLTQVAVATALLTAATSATANNSTKGAQDAELEQIIVTANRSQQDKFLSLSATEVIGRAEIEAIQPQNITELLNTISGVSVANLGGAGQSSSVFMRGTNGNHTLILVDGVRVGSATLGTTSFSTMSVALIDRIEVVKGPRGALWGSDAIGGVIQIFTKKLHSGEGVVSAGIGSHGFWKTEGAIGLGNEQHSLTIAAAAEKSDGFNITDYPGQEDEDGYERQSISVNGQSKLSDQYSLSLVSRYEEGGADYDNQYGGADENEHENYSVKLGGQYSANQLQVDLSAATSQVQGGTVSYSADNVKKVDEITTKRNQLSLVANYQVSELTSVAGGIDWFKEKVSNNYDLSAWTDGYQQWARKDRTVKAAFVQGRHQMNDFLFEGAIRKDDVEALGNETTYNISAGYQIQEDWLVSASRGTGFKAPTFNDLYWPGSGNPDLKPEKVTSNEILLRNRQDNGLLEVSVYNSKIENLIAWAPNAEGNWQPANVDAAKIKGIDLSFNQQFVEFSHKLAVSYTKTKDEKTGDELLRRPKVKASYTLGYALDKLNAHLMLDYRGKSYDRGDVELSDVLLTNLSLSYNFSDSFVVTGKVNNLFDSEYQVADHYLTDGTNYKLTATYSF